MCLPLFRKVKASGSPDRIINHNSDPSAGSREILRSSVKDLGGARIDLARTATPRRYRLIHCQQYVRHDLLCIHEFTELSSIPYAAISYIWKGNRTPPEGSGEPQTDVASFTVVGVSEDGDPASVSVLYSACTAALSDGVQWLWLDCLCIIQTNSEDKAWQIQRMHDIYRGCRVSIVLPGGLSRLVPLDEETRWITRAWTLQEVVAPPDAVVVFSWALGSGRWEGWEGGVAGDVTEVCPGVSAKMPLGQLLRACHYSQALTWTPNDSSKESRDDISPSVLGDYGDSSVGALMWTLQATEPEERAMALWQASMLRTSSRPVDMVFSIMGAFGVTLDPRAFHKNDRIGATVALGQGILRQGGKPVWLGVSLDIRPSRFISSFPDFPVTNVDGTVRWSQRRGPVQPNVSDAIYDIDALNDEVDDEDVSSVLLPQYWLTDVPRGSMDDDGYLTISTKAAPIVSTGHVLGRRRTNLVQNNDDASIAAFSDVPHGVIRIAGTDGRIWDIPRSGEHDEPPQSDLLESESRMRTYIVIVGTSKRFHLDPIYQPDPRPIGGIVLPEMSPIRACAVEEHRPGKFHRSSTFLLDEKRFAATIARWPVLSVAIGGPEELPSGLQGR